MLRRKWGKKPNNPEKKLVIGSNERMRPPIHLSVCRLKPIFILIAESRARERTHTHKHTHTNKHAHTHKTDTKTHTQTLVPVKRNKEQLFVKIQ